MAQEPRAPEVTVSGGPTGADARGPRRPARRRAVALGIGAAVLLAAAVVAQRAERLPAQECPEPCLVPDSVVVGAVLPLTGALAPYGAAQQRGVEQALERVAADGGLDLADGRRPVQLLVRDTRSEPDVAGQEALVLVRGPFRLSALLGPCLPPLPVVRVAESREVPLLTGCQPAPDLGSRGPQQTWEIAPGEAARADAVFEALTATSPSRRTGVFVTNDRSEGPWVDAAQRAGFEITGAYRPQGREWGPAVTRAAADAVEVVVAVTQPPEGIALWRALREQGLVPRAAYASEAGLGSAWHTAVGSAGERTLTDLVHPSVRRPATPAQLDEAVTTVSAELTSVLLAGLRRSGTAARDDLRAALPGARGQVAGQVVRFSGDQASRPPPRLARWEGGRLVPLPR